VKNLLRKSQKNPRLIKNSLQLYTENNGKEHAGRPEVRANLENRLIQTGQAEKSMDWAGLARQNSQLRIHWEFKITNTQARQKGTFELEQNGDNQTDFIYY